MMKHLKIMSMLLGGLLALGNLTACGGSEDEPEVSKAASAKAEYMVTLSQDLLNAATVTIYYIGSDGQQAQETVTSSPWTKSVSFASLPTQAGFSVQPTLKGEPSEEEYTIDAKGQMIITLLDQKGAALGDPIKSGLNQAQSLLGPDFLGQFLTRISSRLYDAKAIAADGTITDTTINWGGNADDDDPNRDTEVTSEGATGTTRSI